MKKPKPKAEPLDLSFTVDLLYRECARLERELIRYRARAKIAEEAYRAMRVLLAQEEP